MTKINIIGAGMSGLLAANMLRRHDITVYEKQPELPNNHHAVLRFKTPKVGEILGIPFRKVTLVKSYVPYKNMAADSLSYSRKCTGIYKSDRSIIEGSVVDVRYVAPQDLIEQMSKDIDIKYRTDYLFINNLPTISTIPMPLLMQLLDYILDVNFDYLSGSVLSATIEDCDAFISVLFPGLEPYSRATITENNLIVEFPNIDKVNLSDFNLNKIVLDLGIADAIITDIQIKQQEYFKITDINEAERKKFQRWATINHNIYSLGRFATWRPKLLLDDLIEDVRKIEGWITGGK